jgi:hypothetical protein
MGPYYLTALVQMLGPIKTVSGFSSRAQGKRTIGSGPRGGETFDVTVDTQVLALLEFASGPIATATFSFDAPTGFRELRSRHRSCHPSARSEPLPRVGVPVQEGREQG